MFRCITPIDEMVAIFPEAENFIIDNPVTFQRELYDSKQKTVAIALSSQLICEHTSPGKPFGFYKHSFAEENEND